MELGFLAATSDVRLSESIVAGVRASRQLEEAITSFPRPIELDVLTSCVDETIRRFSNGDDKEARKAESDKWLGIRLHAALRLRRDEAHDDRIWVFLAAYAYPDYVAWRWGADRVQERTFSTDIKKQAFKRLWWVAELFRNGPSYLTAEMALAKSDIPNTYASLRAIHSRPVALALLNYIDRNNLGSRQANPLSTQLRTSAVTVALDSTLPSNDEAAFFDQSWYNENPDENEVLTQPRGPEHGSVTADEISAISRTLDRVIDLERIRRFRKEKNNNGQEPTTESQSQI